MAMQKDLLGLIQDELFSIEVGAADEVSYDPCSVM
jgi:hypothetical protein